MSIHDIPKEIIIKYKLHNLLKPNNCIYIKSCSACMDSYMQVSLPMNSSKSDSTHMGVNKERSSPDYGNMIGTPSGSP